ncbi:hypothetical protein ACWDUD_29335 [Rhodococcus sp. NPDC003382]|nr:MULTISPECIES: hypothetical protein [unclassified Rhodococcus (in: high G+C Gram-positive bacteria)]MBH0120401.1 hypothetical protein [Rhodococcus sp. CX]MCK8673858.1 hypothetical protein [Rhodococcus sp. HM1]
MTDASTVPTAAVSIVNIRFSLNAAPPVDSFAEFGPIVPTRHVTAVNTT